MIIYKTTNTVNGKIYIGKDSKNDPNYYGSGTILQSAILKYGKDKFIKETLEICSDSNVDSKEKYWIKYFSSTERGIGYNIATGGTGGDTISNHPRRDEIAKNQSIRLTGKDSQRTTKGPLSEETKQKISDSVSGEKNGMYGKCHSQETREKISKANKGKIKPPMSNETRQKISNANEGKTHSNETKLKIGIANAGKNNGFYGKTHTPAVKKMLSENAKKPKSEEHKKNLSKANKGKYNGSQNKKFIANNSTYTSLGDCFRKTGEPMHIIRKKLKNGEYNYI